MTLHQRDEEGKAFLLAYFKGLEGARIENVRMVDDEFEAWNIWPTFDAVMPNGERFKVEVSQDEEGNGPGFLFGLPTPKEEKT